MPAATTPTPTTAHPIPRTVPVTARSFTTPAGQAQFEAAYAATLAQWPVPYERLDVPTRFGSTHVVACGPVDAPPLILLHAFGFGAASWYANVGAWSAQYRVYAVETMGDVNNSVMEQAIRTRAQFALWLGDVMDALGVPSAPLVGHSYGGWLAMNMALCAPDRVQRLVLLAPAASFARLKLQFGLRNLALILFRKRRWAAISFARWCVKPGNEIPASCAEQFHQGVAHFRWGWVVRPNVYTDAELQQMQTPALLLLGDSEVIYDTQAVLARAKRLLPTLQTAIIADAAHSLITEQPAAVNRRVLHFLGAGE